MATRRQLIWKRAHGRCEYCQLAQVHTNLPHEVDHIRAKKHRGPTNLQNTCLTCAYCNAAKGPCAAGFDPETDQLVPLFNPRLDNWTEHFVWNGPILEGRTAIGRATIAVLGINRAERIAHRRLLLEAGPQASDREG
ncbi:MAG TPA: HNH endonuclease signature motif containing protein [Gemmataceae bacterium]|nr:HNH endonuclease signature motif containing protein [Gemmataceae bacterium]